MKKSMYDIVKTTELASLSAYKYVGCGDKNLVDSVAVISMRDHLNNLDIDGTVVIGEGEIDRAPMLYIGERLGTGNGPSIDIAVDPIEGTRMVAMGQSNAMSTIAFAPSGTLLSAPDMYMEKLIVGSKAKGAINLNESLEVNLVAIAESMGKPVQNLVMATLDKPRHDKAIEVCNKLGVKVYALSDGDVAASVMCCIDKSNIDVMYTIGGAPEGVISACAVKALDGDMNARLMLISEAKGQVENYLEIEESEKSRCEKMGISLGKVYQLNELVKSGEVVVSLTGITKGDLTNGIEKCNDKLVTQTWLLNSMDRAINVINTTHYTT